MKKSLFIILLVFSTNLYCQQIKVVKGDFGFISKTDSINIIFDYKGLTMMADSIPEQQFIEIRIKSLQEKNYKDAQMWVDEWQTAKQQLWPENFATNLNRVFSKKHHLKFEQGLNTAEYTLRVKTNWIYPGWFSEFMNQKPKVKATLQFVETSNPENLLLELEAHIYSGVDSNLEIRLGENYAKMGTLLGRLILKNGY